MIDGDYPPDQSFALEGHTHPGGGTLHEDLTDVTSDQHHAQSHTLTSHSTRAHSELTGVGATDHHSNANDHVNSEAAHAWHTAHHTRLHTVTDTSDHTFPGGSTFLRADGTWASPPGGSEAFPIGAVFIAVVSTNPNTLLGYGTWSAIAAGRVLVGLDSGDTDFDTVEETGGAKTHVHTDNLTHSGAAVANHTDVLNHVHNQTRLPTATGGSTGFTVDTSMSGTPATTSVDTGNPTANGVAAQVHGVTQPSAHGSHAATDHKPPYFVVHVWKRTA